MIKVMLDAMLGSVGRSILAFVTENLSWFVVVFLIWAAIIFFSVSQLNKARKMSVQLFLKAIHNDETKSDQQIWDEYFPAWQQAFQVLNLRLIPTHSNFWVKRACEENVVDTLCLGPDWITALRTGQVLKHKGALPGEEYKTKAANAIKTKKVKKTK